MGRILAHGRMIIAGALFITLMGIVSTSGSQVGVDGIPPVSADGDDSSPKVVLSNNPGTLRIDATWGHVPEASIYRVRWRLRGSDFTDSDVTKTENAEASFDVQRQGLWVVRVESCNDAGCQKHATGSINVVVNIPGHEAVRL